MENTLQGDGSELAVQLKFNAIEDFEPANVVQQVEPLRKLMETRNKLRDLMTKIDVSAELEKLLEDVMENTENLEKLSKELGKTGSEDQPEEDQVMSSGETQREAQAAPAVEAGGLLDQVLSATPQTERNRAAELVEAFVGETLKGTLVYKKDLMRDPSRRASRPSTPRSPSNSRPSCTRPSSRRWKAPGAACTTW